MSDALKQAKTPRWRRVPAGAAIALALLGGVFLVTAETHAQRRPNFLIVTVDTLRPDHLSGYGYERPTSPNIDRLMARGVRFTQARAPVGLTCPALASMITTLEPHEHGSTRNGLRVRPGLASMPKFLTRRGYTTAAFVSNWTLKDTLCGLAEHFDTWEEILERRRWLFGRREAEAEDVTDEALAWLEEHVEENGRDPFFLWVHYVEPHFPYVLHEEFLDQLGLGVLGSTFSPRDRYDSEIAYVDASIGRFLERFDELVEPESAYVVFTADHGESLGDHGFWGHGKHVYEAELRIPLAIVRPGQIEPSTIRAPAKLDDLAATLFGLAEFPVPDFLEGYDFAPVMRGEAPDPLERVTYHQGHKGTVKPHEDQRGLRRRGLLEVGRVEEGRKEVWVVKREKRRVFDLEEDREELDDLAEPGSPISEELAAWLEEVRSGLVRSDSLPPPNLSEEEIEQLEALGYLD